MDAVFFSDAHLSCPTDSNYIKLLQWLETIQAKKLFIVGDLFDFCWSYKSYTPIELKPMLEKLAQLAQRGTEITLLTGNRDFRFPVVTFPISIKDSITLQIGNKNIYVAHGDQADRSPKYRITKLILRSFLFDWYMKGIGPQKGYQLLQKLTVKSRAKAVDSKAILQQQKTWAQNHFKNGIDIVIAGHSHHCEKIGLHGGELYCIGDWVHLFSFLSIENEELKLHRL